MHILRRCLYLAAGTLLWHDAAWGQNRADLRAAEETHIPGLRLINPRHADAQLSLLGIRFGYVLEDARLGSSGRYSCGALSVDRAVTAVEPVWAGMARLPYVSLRKLGLRYLILCGGATSGDRPIGGIPVPPLDLLLLNVGTAAHALNPEGSTLHELWHMAEFRFNTIRDAEWDRQFTGYRNDYAPELMKGTVGSGNAGFVTSYAQTFPQEDRAELFEALLLKPSEVLARLRATGDTLLQRKVRFMDEKSQRLLALKLAPDGL